MQRKFKQILAEYTKQSIRLKHHYEDNIDQVRSEAWSETHKVLKNKYLFTFQSNPDRDTVERINLIHHYVAETLLPPIVEKLEEEIIINRQRHELAVRAIEQILQALSTGDAAATKGGAAKPAAKKAAAPKKGPVKKKKKR